MTELMTFFTRDEVVIHNSTNDMWVILNGNVLDLTNLFEGRIESMNDVREFFVNILSQLTLMHSIHLKNLRLLLAYAGKDLSWCFNKEGSPILRVNQYGHCVAIFPPVDEKENGERDFWWRDASYVIGKLTCLKRSVRIINTLSRKIIVMSVCEEDSIKKIKEKYKEIFNSNADSYIWRKSNSQESRKKSGNLFMNKTLTQNGILYQENEQLGLPPAIWLYYSSNIFCQ